MELGRECLKLWGYERVDEIIWVKTNQLVSEKIQRAVS
jgi:mRNA (2'-O-methyladenosine-N6-)-methyltransferase